MLRVFGFRRAELSQPAGPMVAPEAVAAPSAELQWAPEAYDSPPADVRPWYRFTWKRLFMAVCLFAFALAGVGYVEKDAVTPKAADLSRKVIGDERTARIEGWFFNVEDHMDRWKYRLFGGEENPFHIKPVQVQFVARPEAQQITYFVGTSRAAGQLLTADAFEPVPMQLPQTQLILADAQPGEGAWTTAGLPHNAPGDVLMAKTFIRPDRARPYASVGVLLIDQRRIHLKMVGGTAEPGGDRGVKGPGVIAREDYGTLLAAFNGGFKGPHGSYGMVANGKEYMRMRNGLATLCVSKDGTMKLGEFGRDFNWEDSFEACRQNTVLLVDKGEVSKRTTEGNDTWGYVNVNSSEFITWRSAVGVTKDGNLLIAAGNSLSADSLARALWAAGAYMAMQLDINAPYICTALFYPQPDGSVKAEKFMDSMAPSASNFLAARERDFMYVTLDERRYR